MNWTLIIIAIVLIGAVVGGGYLYVSSTIAAKDKIIEEQRINLTAKQIDIEKLTVSNKSLSEVVVRREQELEQSRLLIEKLRATDAEALILAKAVDDFTRNPMDIDKANKYLECRTNSFPDIEKCLDLLK